MGGEHSGCDENTTDVLIEIGALGPITTARTGTHARYHHRCPLRFERGVDPESCPRRRIGDETGVSISAAVRRRRPNSPAMPATSPRSFRSRCRKVTRLTGIEVPKAEASISRAPWLHAARVGDVVDVRCVWRPDVDGKADLVEEVMRIPRRRQHRSAARSRALMRSTRKS